MGKRYEYGAGIKNDGTVTAADERFGIKNDIGLWRIPPSTYFA